MPLEGHFGVLLLHWALQKLMNSILSSIRIYSGFQLKRKEDLVSTFIIHTIESRFLCLGVLVI